MEHCEPHENIGPEPEHQTLPSHGPVVVESMLVPDMPVGPDEIDAIIRLLGAELDDVLD
jgi:hypothetical protein